MLNDHTTKAVSEEQVMQDAFGGDPNSLKSACNLVYINSHISSLSEKLTVPVFSDHDSNVSRLKIKTDTMISIRKENQSFLNARRDAIISSAIEKIH